MSQSPAEEEKAANENVSSAWDGKAPHKGWHWLKRKGRAGDLRIAFSLSGSSWRIADSIGRTAVFPATTVRKLFDYIAPVDPPRHEDLAE
jgi:hypothetical protein